MEREVQEDVLGMRIQNCSSFFFRHTGHHNRNTIPGQRGGGECHAQHSGHIFQQ